MADTTFVPGTIVASTWLNDVNRLTYDAPKPIGATLIGTSEGVSVQQALERRLSIAQMTGAIGTLAGRSVYNTLPVNFQYLDANSGNLYVRSGPVGNWDGPFPFGGGTVSVNVGNVYTGSPGSSVIVTNSGTPQNVVLNFTIPQGVAGTNGTNGADGAPGAAGAPGAEGPQGPAGAAGPANTLTIGTVVSGPANATITGTAPNQVLNLTLPPGTNGTNGAAATIAVGTTTTGAPGTNASVTNVGTSSAAILNFTIPRGDTGSGGGGSGDVVGPASAVNNNMAVFDGTTGKLIKDGGAPLVIGTTATTAKAGNYQPASTDISDSTATGRSVLTAANAAAARTAIGAGTSNLAIGTTGTTAKAGDYQPTAANISDSTVVGRAVLTAANAAAARGAIGAGTSDLVLGTTNTTAKAGDYQPTIPSQATAEAGTNNTEYMTPLRTAQATAGKLNRVTDTAQGLSLTYVDNGSVGSGTSTLNAATGDHYRIQATGNMTVAISNWPAAGKSAELMLEAVNFGGFTITWPTINWVKSDGTFTTTHTAAGFTWQTTGIDFVLLWTRDGGTTVYGKVMR